VSVGTLVEEEGVLVAAAETWRVEVGTGVGTAPDGRVGVGESAPATVGTVGAAGVTVFTPTPGVKVKVGVSLGTITPGVTVSTEGETAVTVSSTGKDVCSTTVPNGVAFPGKRTDCSDVEIATGVSVRDGKRGLTQTRQPTRVTNKKAITLLKRTQNTVCTPFCTEAP
jgi:hypothetical protein